MSKQYEVTTFEVPEEINKRNENPLTVPNVAFELSYILKAHKGKKNAITGSKLFKELYKRPLVDGYVEEYLWDYLLKGLRYLRAHTTCQPILTRQVNEEPIIYVMTAQSDSEKYKKHIDNCISSMRRAQKRADLSIKQRWYNKDWHNKDGSLITVSEKLE